MKLSQRLNVYQHTYGHMISNKEPRIIQGKKECSMNNKNPYKYNNLNQ